MPVHDWTRVEAGIFHAFHHDWITEIARALNRGLLPSDYYALPEQIAGEFGPDVLTLSTSHPASNAGTPSGGIALAVAPPKVDLRMRSEARAHLIPTTMDSAPVSRSVQVSRKPASRNQRWASAPV